MFGSTLLFGYHFDRCYFRGWYCVEKDYKWNSMESYKMTSTLEIKLICPLKAFILYRSVTKLFFDWPIYKVIVILIYLHWIPTNFINESNQECFQLINVSTGNRIHALLTFSGQQFWHFFRSPIDVCHWIVHIITNDGNHICWVLQFLMFRIIARISGWLWYCDHVIMFN